MIKKTIRYDSNLIEHTDYIISETDTFSFQAVPNDIGNLDLVSKLELIISDEQGNVLLTKQFEKQADNSFVAIVTTAENETHFDKNITYNYAIQLTYSSGDKFYIEKNSNLLFR